MLVWGYTGRSRSRGEFGKIFEDIDHTSKYVPFSEGTRARLNSWREKVVCYYLALRQWNLERTDLTAIGSLCLNVPGKAPYDLFTRYCVGCTDSRPHSCLPFIPPQEFFVFCEIVFAPKVHVTPGFGLKTNHLHTAYPILYHSRTLLLTPRAPDLSHVLLPILRRPFRRPRALQSHFISPSVVDFVGTPRSSPP